MTRVNQTLISVLSAIWLILLALCALIGTLIVPVDGTTTGILVFFISIAKVLISLLFILIWLVGWYRLMQYLLLVELHFKNSSPTNE